MQSLICISFLTVFYLLLASFGASLYVVLVQMTYLCNKLYDMRRHWYLSLCVIFVLMMVAVSRMAASVVEHSSGYTVSHLGMEQGLSSNYVVDIAQDRNGFLWFATEEGLNRFDGSRFYAYYQGDDGRGLSGNELNRLLPDAADAVMWVGTQRAGVNAFHYLTGRFVHYRHDDKNRNSLIADDVTDVAAAHDGNIWVATYWSGVDYLDKRSGKFTHFNRSTVRHLVSNQSLCVLDAGGDQLYVGHVNSGLSVINTRTRVARNFRHNTVQPGSLSGDQVNCLLKDRTGHLWVGTDKGLDLFDPIKEEFIHISGGGHLRKRIYAIAETADGQIYVGSEFGGVTILNPSHPLDGGTSFPLRGFIGEGPLPTSLTGSTVRSLFQDRYHNIWVGLYGSGVNFITSQLPTIGQITYSMYKEERHLTNKTVFGVATDVRGNLWLGTDGGGINVFSPSGERIAEYPTEAGNCVQAIFRDSQGTLWMGTYNEGAWMKTATGPIQRVEGVPQNSDVRGFYEDDKGYIWIATSRGVYQADERTRKVTHYHALSHELVRTLCFDRQGRLWVGTFGSGLRIYSPTLKFLRAFSVERGFPSNNVSHIIRDHAGRMWVGTGNGLVLFSQGLKETYMVYNQKRGLNNAHIRALVEDHSGNIWASTNKGVSCLRPGQSNFTNYWYKDNLPMGNFSDGCVTMRPDGTLVFGSTEGVAFFKPELLLSRRSAPEVFITDAILLGGIKNPGDSVINLVGEEELKLSYRNNTFSVRFNIQNYALAGRVEYAYKLKGMNGEWITTDLNEVTLRNLPYGSYQLQVRCRLRNQPWPNEIATLDIVVTPPFWLSWPAKVFYALLLLGILIAFMRFYKRKIRLEYLYQSEKRQHEHEQELNQERMRFYTNITHELRTPLTLIMGPLDDISHHSDIPKETKHKLAVIHSSAERLNNLINQILEFRKTETENRRLCVGRGDIVGSVQEVCIKYEELSRKEQVTIRFEGHESPIEVYFDKEVLTIIVDNLVSNAIKYTDRGEIVISVARRRKNNRQYVEIAVTDTGYGISAEALPHIFERYYQENGEHQASGTGIGLALVKNLVDLHQGTISVSSSVDQGSRFSVLLDADNIYPDSMHQELGREEVKDADEEEVQPGADTAIPDRPIVIVVEDNKEIRDYISESLSGRYDVRTAKDGREGLALALDATPDIIISDIMMPNMDGNEMCRRIKADIRTSHVPVILLTAKDTVSAIEEGYESGADSYLTKPFTSSLLEARVRNLLRQRQTLLRSLQPSSDATLEQKREQLRSALNEMDRQFYDKVNSLIEESISGDVDVNYLVANLNMSTSTLYRKMKAVTGVTTSEYIRQYKMRYAEKLLLEGKYSISEISFMVGMSSVAYFRKCFKEEFGQIPSEYIKKLKEQDGKNNLL